MPLSDDLQTIPRLLGDAAEQLGKLVQNEVQLAKAELTQKITQAGLGAAYIVGAAVLLVPVMVVALIALALWLAQLGMSPPVAHLAAAGLGAVLCSGLFLVGASYLKAENLRPNVTIREVQRTVDTAKELAR